MGAFPACAGGLFRWWPIRLWPKRVQGGRWMWRKPVRSQNSYKKAPAQAKQQAQVRKHSGTTTYRHYLSLSLSLCVSAAQAHLGSIRGGSCASPQESGCPVAEPDSAISLARFARLRQHGRLCRLSGLRRRTEGLKDGERVASSMRRLLET